MTCLSPEISLPRLTPFRLQEILGEKKSPQGRRLHQPLSATGSSQGSFSQLCYLIDETVELEEETLSRNEVVSKPVRSPRQAALKVNVPSISKAALLLHMHDTFITAQFYLPTRGENSHLAWYIRDTGGGMIPISGMRMGVFRCLLCSPPAGF